MVGDSSFKLESSDPFWRSKLERVTRKGEMYTRTMKPVGGGFLWPDVPKTANASDLHENYARLLEMAIALETRGTDLYGDASLEETIIQGLDWVYVNRYNEHTTVYGNWWQWEIGAPLPLLNALSLMRERLSRETIDSYLRPIDRFVPDPVLMRNSMLAEPYPSTGANRVWKSRAYLFSALLKGDKVGIEAAREALSPVFDFVTEGDGFYKDGSFIQHKRHPYTGGYGKSLLKELAELVYVLHGTPWELGADKVGIMMEWIGQSFDPFLFNGQIMDMVRGREVSRPYYEGKYPAHIVIGAALQLAEAAAPEQASWLLGKAKSWMAGDTCRHLIDQAPLIVALAACRAALDDTVQPEEERPLCKLFPQMDRAVARESGHAIGISMFSERTGSYESINGEHVRGWYTAHGMTYVYNADPTSYSDGFWPTVDPYRLPGTTVSKEPRSEGFGLDRKQAGAFVGGAVCDGRYGIVGMELVEQEQFRARKSWFLFGDVWVALGTVLQGAAASGLETIVENRKLDREGSNTILVTEADGEVRSFSEAESVKTLQPRWLHLSGSVPGSDIGYVFPHPKPLHLLRESRSGRWRDLSVKGSAEKQTRSYFTSWFQHDARERDDEYAYLLLPGRSPEQVAEYADDPGIEIVASTRDIHAVTDRWLGLFAVHFWEDGQQAAGPVRCDKKASIVMKESHEEVEVCIADPSQKGCGPMSLELDISVEDVITHDERIIVKRLDPVVVLSVQLEGAKGRTQSIVFRKSLDQGLAN